MIDAFDRGDLDEAREMHLRLLPAYTGLFRTHGVILAKAVLTLRGLPAGPVRPPLVDATADQIARLKDALAAAGL